jgi:hypothetical protein
MNKQPTEWIVEELRGLSSAQYCQGMKRMHSMPAFHKSPNPQNCYRCKFCDARVYLHVVQEGYGAFATQKAYFLSMPQK